VEVSGLIVCRGSSNWEYCHEGRGQQEVCFFVFDACIY